MCAATPLSPSSWRKGLQDRSTWPGEQTETDAAPGSLAERGGGGVLGRNDNTEKLCCRVKRAYTYLDFLVY